MIEYLRLKCLLYSRMFREFPLIMQILFPALFVGIIYGLKSTHIELNLKTGLVIIFLQLFLSIYVHSISSREVILLSSLKIRIRRIRLIRVVILSLFFFLLNPLIAVPGVVFGIVSVFLTGIRQNNSFKLYILPVFYIKTSYRWIASYRKGGVWMIVLFFFLQIMGYIHRNVNMVIVFSCFLISFPCFYALLMKEPKVFLQYYRTPFVLIKTKIMENLVNSIILIFFTLPVVLFMFIENNTNITGLYVACIYINLLAEGIYYADYPVGMIGVVIFLAIIFLLVNLQFQFPFYIVLILALIILLLSYYFAYSHIKTIIYENN